MAPDHGPSLVEVAPGLPIRAGVARRPDPATSALLARFSTQPNAGRRRQIDLLIRSLKNDGVWSKLDALYVTAAHDAQAAQRNWIADAYNLTPTNAPTFTADSGYSFDGTTNYLNTDFNPATAVTPKYQQDDASLGAWWMSRAGTGRAGNNTARIGQNATQDYARANDGTNAGGTNDAASRLVSWSRSVNTAYDLRNNGATRTSPANASTGVTGAAILIGALGVGGIFGDEGVRAFWIGGALTEAQDAAAYSALQAYLQAVGAI